MSNTIKNGQHIIIVDNSKNKRLYKLSTEKKISHYKNAIDSNQLIGKQFNSFF